MRFKTVIIIVLVLLVSIVAIQNSRSVDLEFLIWKLRVSRIVLILISFSLGILVGLLLTWKKSRKSNSAIESEYR